MNPIKPLIMRGAELDAQLSIGRTTRHAKQDPKSPQYDPTFPVAIKLSTRSTGYLVSEVEAWLASRPRVRETDVQEQD